MNRTERALKRQARKRMQRARDEKNCILHETEGAFTSYNSLMEGAEKSRKVRDLNKEIKAERRKMHSAYKELQNINEKLSYAILNNKEEMTV